MSEPRQLNFTTAQFEHTLGILAEVDLAPMLSAFQRGGRVVDLLGLLPMLGQAREKKFFRRLEAVWGAEPDELERAESDDAQMKTLMCRASKVPIKDTLEGITAFFASLGLSLNDTPASLRAQMIKNLLQEEVAPEAGPAASPSEG